MQQSQIRLVLLDNHGLFRASLARLLAMESDLVVAGECGTPAEVLDLLKNSTVDVVLLDFNVDAEHGNDVMSLARQGGYQGRFLIVAGSADVRNAAMALKLGASGIFLKSDTPNHLIQAIRIVGLGATWVDWGILQSLADRSIGQCSQFQDPNSDISLEQREQNVLNGIVEGLTNRKIGEKMGLSESGVKNIVQRLFGKARVNTRSQLVRIAMQGLTNGSEDGIERRSNELPGAIQPKPYGHPRVSEPNPLSARQSH